jgi:acetyltransferase
MRRSNTQNLVLEKTTAPCERHLNHLLNPRSIALIGASDREGSVGHALAKNLSSFKGKLFFINKKRPTVLGLPCHRVLPRPSGIKDPIDLAIIATPAETVSQLVSECAEAGVKTAIVISAGFNEAGAAGRKLQAELTAKAKRHDVRILGPNCLGLISPHSGLNASFATELPTAGSLAFISQSGALCTALLDWSLNAGVGFSGFVSLGSMSDIGWGDLIRHFQHDARTRCIVMYIESLGDVTCFVNAAMEASRTKPLFAIKVGRTNAAAAAAATHTGSMTGDDEVMDAVLEKAGVVRLDKVGELFDIASLASHVLAPENQKLSILTNAGGPAALATDVLVRSGGSLSRLSQTSIDQLNARLPAHWSHSNPTDILGDADANRYADALRVVLDDPDTDGVLAILTPQYMTEPLRTAEALIKARASTKKPIIASWMGGTIVEAARLALTSAEIPNYEYPDQAALAWQRLAAWKQQLPLLEERRAVCAQPFDPMLPARKALLSCLNDSPLVLTEFQSKRVLAEAGIASLGTCIAESHEEAIGLAKKLGFPVVLKLHSRTVSHKSDVGGVQLNLPDAAAVTQAWNLIKGGVREQDFAGVTVQRMFKEPSVELICGFRQDPESGPVLIFGAGGTLTETLHDTTILLPPLSPKLIIDRLERTRVFKALQGTRHFRAINLQALCELLVQLGKLASAAPEIEECDINPLVFSDGMPLVLDARMKCRALDGKSAIPEFNGD